MMTLGVVICIILTIMATIVLWIWVLGLFFIRNFTKKFGGNTSVKHERKLRGREVWICRFFIRRLKNLSRFFHSCLIFLAFSRWRLVKISISSLWFSSGFSSWDRFEPVAALVMKNRKFDKNLRKSNAKNVQNLDKFPAKLPSSVTIWIGHDI